MGLKDKITSAIENMKAKLKGNPKNAQFLINIVIIILINIAAAAFTLRIDLTRSDTYSLSDRSKEIVSNLDENLKIKIFFSKDLPAEHAAVYRYLKDILEEYDYYGNRHFSYEFVDEDKLEAQATDYGINPVQSREFANDQVKVRNVYMAVVIQHADLIEKIDALSTTVGLEYEITSRIEKMTDKIDALLKMKDPLMLTLYLDSRLKELPIEGINKLEDTVKNAVAKSNLRNYGKIGFRVIDPSTMEKPENIAAQFGITRLQWGAAKSKNGKPVPAGQAVFGIVVEGNGKFRKINIDVAPTLFGGNVITGLEKMDDRINETVSDLLSSSPRIGYVKGHGIPDINDKRTPDGAGLYSDILSDMYQFAEVDLASQDIPDDVRVLIINGPTDAFTDAEKFKIDQFIMQGKSLLLFVNSFIEMNNQQQMGFMGGQPMVIPVNNGLDDMITHYGIKVNKNVVLDRNCTKVNLGSMISDYPLMPMLGKKELNRESVVTRHLNGALFFKASSVELDGKLKDKGITSTVLVSTSPESWLMEGRMNFNPMFMQAPSGKEFKSYPIAAIASGKFESFYKGKEIPAPAVKDAKGVQGKSGITAQSKLDATVDSGKSEIIVVGSSDITSSGFINHSRRILAGGGTGDAFSNDILLHSMVDYLAGNLYVPEMKSKSLDHNPLIKTEDNTRFLLKVINIGFVPLFVVITGFVVWRRRIAQRKSVEAMFAGGEK